MKKVKKIESTYSFLDVVALLFAGLYLQSVLTVAHHIAFRPHDVPSVVESPQVVLAVISAALVVYSWHTKRGLLSRLSIVSTTILVTSSIFWLSGLRANFF